MYIAVKFVTDTHTYIHRDKGTHRARLLSIYLSLIPFKSHHSDIMTRFNRTSKYDTVPLTSKEIFMITISGITLSYFKKLCRLQLHSNGMLSVNKLSLPFRDDCKCPVSGDFENVCDVGIMRGNPEIIRKILR